MPRLNYKIATNNLRELFNEVDTRKRNEIGFDDFANLYHKIIFEENVRTLNRNFLNALLSFSL